VNSGQIAYNPIIPKLPMQQLTGQANVVIMNRYAAKVMISIFYETQLVNSQKHDHIQVIHYC